MKRKSEKFAKIAFVFLRADVSNMAPVKINGKAVNKGKRKRMKVSCASAFNVRKQILSELKEVF